MPSGLSSSGPSWSQRFQLDLRVILEAPLRLMAPWLAVVLIVTWAGQPGVVCITPVAWLLALRVGLAVAGRSASPQPAQRLREAALAGALFGLLQGVLFGVLVLRIGEIRPEERAGAAGLIAFVLLGGMLAGAVMSYFTAAQVERRRRAAL